ncbi:hypothetical protein WA026_000393 [Henosepilachna vigintioctopunctata]|uniref:FHA domain-containing protein n=1 Tax=Henosepilachna vigintioctopunctata TaxID=420089 RepID=A0AAW1V7H2_9CUCU
MVVVSDSWVKNVATFPTPAMNEMDMIITNNETKMYAKAVLICRQNSHPFQDRTLCLDDHVKVGRAVARARAKPNNAIFDCKVLSRNHAMLWYDNGKFFLQDTKSSNGTFVNNNKLTPETEHHEVSSGDIVQFGVDVIENNRKVTHGCIIATLKLYLPDGKEAKASPSISENNRYGMVPLDELYKLNKIIQDASAREECLQKKLDKLHCMLQSAKSATSTCWASYVGEERLLSRIATLETQLSQANKNWTEDKCKQELSKIQDANVSYQVATIETLERLHTEKLDVVAYVKELEIKKNTIEEEGSRAKKQAIALQKELDELLKNYIEEQKTSEKIRTEYETKIQDLQTQLNEKNELMFALETKMDSNIKTNGCNIKDELEKSNFICPEDDLKIKKEMLENEEQENSPNSHVEEPSYITLTVGPVQSQNFEEYETNIENENGLTDSDDNHKTWTDSEDSTTEEPVMKEKLKKDVKFDLPENDKSKNSDDEEVGEKEIEEESVEDNEIKLVDNIDSKTLKYHFQSTQNELKKRIESLDQLCKSNQLKVDELENILSEERKLHAEVKVENELLKEELQKHKTDLEKTNEENRELKNEVNILLASKEVGAGDAVSENIVEKEDVKSIEKIQKVVSYEELVSVEEELVILKERFSQVNEDKVKLKRDIDELRKEYNLVRNQSHNTTFFYVAPLVLIVLYLLVSKILS